jgi:hypothetical protein
MCRELHWENLTGCGKIPAGAKCRSRNIEAWRNNSCSLVNPKENIGRSQS